MLGSVLEVEGPKPPVVAQLTSKLVSDKVVAIFAVNFAAIFAFKRIAQRSISDAEFSLRAWQKN